MKSYHEKLVRFNSTEKYKNEMRFLKNIMNPQKGEKVLDFGCGVGTMVRFLLTETDAEVFGYDVCDWTFGENPFRFRNEYHFRFDKVYFMHSIAHIPDIDEALENLKPLLNPGAKIYAVTPNRNWLREIQSREDYKPDPTVVRHFSSSELANVFTEQGFHISTTGQFGEYINGNNERIFIECRYHE